MRNLVFKSLFIFTASVFCLNGFCEKEFGHIQLEKALPQNDVKKALGLNSQQSVAINVFDSFEKIQDQKVNLLFCNGKLYINRFFPIHQAYDNVEICGKKFPSRQVANILGARKEELVALQKIKDHFIKLTNIVERNYYSVEKAFNKMKAMSYEDRRVYTSNLTAGLADNLSWLEEYYEALIEFMNAASTLGYNLSDKEFTKETLNEIYALAKEKAETYKNQIAAYISRFNKQDAEDFSREFANKDTLTLLQPVCSKYGKYAHTEYELMYDLTEGFTKDIPSDVAALSYYDLCSNCEKLWASKVDKECKFVSMVPYGHSRSTTRQGDKVNEHLKLVQVGN